MSGNENGASRRSLAQTDAAWREQDRLAQAAGQTWAEWARARLRLGCIECLRLDAYCFDCRKAADRS